MKCWYNRINLLMILSATEMYLVFLSGIYYIRAGFDFEIISFEELADYYMPTYGSRVVQCVPRQGIERVFSEAKKLGIDQSILSAAKSPDIAKQLTDLGLLDYFSFITGLDDNYANSKVHLAAKHIKSIDCDISEILFVGDTDHDAIVAKEIGCDCVLLTMGHQSKETLAKTGCTVVDDISELLNLIKS